MTIYNLYIFDRHCQCIYFQKWSHKSATPKTKVTGTSTTSQINNSSRLGPLTATTTNSSSRFSASSANSSSHNATNTTTTGDNNSSSLVQSQTVQSGLAAGSVISIEEEAKLVYGVILSLRNFVRKLSGR